MSDRAGQSEEELLFCHQCANEWRGNPNDLQCSQCQGEFVEVVENDNDPRIERAAAEAVEPGPDFLAHNPFRRMNPWARDQPDVEERNAQPVEPQPDYLPHNPFRRMGPWAQDRREADEGNIEHVEWNPGAGIHFSRTSYRSTSPQARMLGQRGNDPFALLQNLFDMPPNQQPNRVHRGNSPRAGGYFSMPASPPHYHSPWHAPPPPMHEPYRNHVGFGPRNTYTSTTRVWPSPTNQGTNHLQDIMNALFQGMEPPNPNGQNGPRSPGGQGPAGFPTLQQLFASVLNPANAAHGDVVYSQEALDRIISQFMDAHNGSTAPGPASAAAISALPKKTVDKNMLGSDGKAECSVCMDNVELGDEVTLLPCSHWFHEACVGAWLKEHDTCPHCRQGIMPKDAPGEGADSNTGPRSPNQEPRNSLPPLSAPTGGFRPRGNSRATPNQPMFRSQLVGSPSTYRHQNPSDLQIPRVDRTRRRSSGSGGQNAGEGGNTPGGGGLTGAIGGWMSRHLGNGNGNGNGDRGSGR